MNLLKARELAESLISEHCPEYKFKWNNRKRAFGVCSYRTKTIQLSKSLTLLNDEEHIKNTILHEIAHAKTEGHKHNRVWKSCFLSLGGSGTRCSNGEVVKGKYVYECPNCNKTASFFRKTTRVRACGECCNKYSGGRYDDKFKMELRK